MSDLQSRLQAAVGDAYGIEKELGGGGMSRVFLAEEVRLGRKVVIKVLPPEMAAGVNVERFEREIQLAARLQHPHVVPLLTAGSSGDLLYYVMPFIGGESLRAKLAREGELPVPESLRILKEVLDALAYAHEQGVVHRDIKPDNVLLSGRHALVTDFGVAKALSDSAPGSAITSLGVALGTPMYMAPEQAAGDPHVDHRADIYAVGATAYEMLTGRAPFTGPNVQAVLSAHITEAPDPVTRHRETVPAGLNEIVMRCLAKKAADRWQHADDLLPQLDALLTPSGGVTPTGTQPVARREAEVDDVRGGTERPAGSAAAKAGRVAALFGLAAVGVLAIVYAAVRVLGLPNWVFYGAIALMAAGLPIILITGQRERRRAIATQAGTPVTTPAGLARHFTWHKAILGGALAFGVLGLVTAAYMAMRVLGIGPVGTLVATGALKERDRLVLADFENRTSDSALGTTVTELFRVGLAQSPLITVLEPAKVGEVLARMEQKAGTRVDAALGREIAKREGLKGIVTGSIVSVGSGYALTAQVQDADGHELAVQQDAAADANGLIAAVGRLSGKLRERIGESLRRIRAEPLDQVTTGSVQALQLYTQAMRAQNSGDETRAIELLKEAVRVDTGFAMAYRKLGAFVGNQLSQRALEVQAVTKAYAHRDRLTERERYHAIAFYNWSVTGQIDQAINAYKTLLDLYPDDGVALNNLGVAYEVGLVDPANAERYYRQALELDSSQTVYWGNVIDAQGLGGKLDDAEGTLARFAARFPGNPRVEAQRSRLDYLRGRHDQAARDWRAVLQSQGGNPLWQARGHEGLARLADLRGKAHEADQEWAAALSAQGQLNDSGAYIRSAIDRARAQALVMADRAAAVRTVDQAVNSHPLESMALLSRPMLDLAMFYAEVDRPERARAFLTRFEQSDAAKLDRDAAHFYRLARGEVLLAEHRPRDAIAEFRAFGRFICLQCWLSPFARAFDAAGEADSAIAYYTQYVETSWNYRLVMDYTDLPQIYRRLAELHEAKGDRSKALEYYGRIADLWKDADPELQPLVRDVKQRMARLAGEKP